MKDFDRWIKKELDDFQVDPPSGAWDDFVRRQSTPEDPADQAFDQEIRQQLRHYQVDKRNTGWARLETTLSPSRNASPRWLRAKVVESFLLLLLVGGFWLLGEPVERPAFRVTSLSPAGTLSGPWSVLPQETTPLASHPKDDPLSATTPFVTASDLGPSRSGTALLKELPPLPSRMTAQVLQGHAPEAVELPLSPRLPDHPTETLPPTSVAFLVPAVSLPIQTGPDPRPRTRHRISLAVHGDLNYIMTPYDQLLNNRGYDQIASGFGASMGYLAERDRWALRGQVSYHRKYYLPKPYTETFDGDIQRGFFTETIRDIELNMLGVSLLAQRTLHRKGRWHTYAMAGGTAHLAFQANYDRRQDFLPGTQDPPPGEIPEPTKPSLTSQKRYADGLFEGGSLAENSYLSVDIGLGLERHYSDRISFFLEPTFQYNPFQKSLGPNADRINTISLATGARVKL